jgi:O-antigen ligase
MAPAVVSLVAILAIPAYQLHISIGAIQTNGLDAVLFLAAIVLLALTKDVKSAALPKRIWVPTAVLLLAAVVGCGIAPDNLSALGILKSWFILPIFFGYSLWKSQVAPQHLRQSLIATGTVAALYAIGNFIATDAWTDYEGVERAIGFFTQPNYLALFLVPLATLAAASLRQLTSKQERLLTVLALISMLVAITLSYSRAGILTIVATIPLIALVQYGWKQCVASITLGVVIFIGAYASIPAFQKRFASILDTKSQTTSRTRVEITQASMNMLEAHPFAGIGLGGYQDAYQDYQVPEALEKDVLHPHNVYLAFWTQSGILGLIAFLTICAFAFVRKLTSTSIEVKAAALAGMSILLVGLFDTAYWKNDLSVVFWVLIAMTMHQARRKDA